MHGVNMDKIIGCCVMLMYIGLPFSEAVGVL
jgi:hypothetical protein